MSKDRGAEQGDVDGLLECSLACGMVAAETRERMAAQQAAGNLPWIGVDDASELQQLRADHAPLMQESADFQLGGPEKRTGAHDPRHALWKNGGLADLWYMDDGDIMCHPILVPPFLQECDVANSKVGAEWNPQKTEVIHNVTDVQSMANVSAVTAGSITLGVAVGPRQYITDQLLGKPDVIRAMHERVQLCQDPQTEFAGSQLHPHPASSWPHNPSGTAGYRNPRRGWTAVS